MKLFPLFGISLAFLFTHTIILDRFVKMLEDVKKGNFGDMEIIHHLSSGMKTLFTQICFNGLQVVRQSIGGAGYSSWSGLCSIIEDVSALPTAEGDNTVM